MPITWNVLILIGVFEWAIGMHMSDLWKENSPHWSFFSTSWFLSRESTEQLELAKPEMLPQATQLRSKSASPNS